MTAKQLLQRYAAGERLFKGVDLPLRGRFDGRQAREY